MIEVKKMKIISSARIKSNIRKQLVETFPNVEFRFFGSMEEICGEISDAEVLITYGEDVKDHHIDMAKQLKWIMVISAGVDQLPFEKIRQRNILVTNAKGIHAKPMAEYTLGMILQVARRAKILYQNEQAKIWDRRVPMTEINGQTITIIGAGTIGTEIARLAKAFGMKTIGINRDGRKANHMDEVYSIAEIKHALKEADYIVSVLPLTSDTYHLINKEMFLSMKSSATFINIGRGQTVCQKDLLEILQEGKISHAVLDVFEEEPPPKDHPFWEMENVTITPHISGLSPFYQPRAFKIFIKNLETYLSKGTNFINVIDPNREY